MSGAVDVDPEIMRAARSLVGAVLPGEHTVARRGTAADDDALFARWSAVPCIELAPAASDYRLWPDRVEAAVRWLIRPAAAAAGPSIGRWESPYGVY